MPKRSKGEDKAKNKFNSKYKQGEKRPMSKNASNNPDRKVEKGSEGFYRTKSTINRLNMYNQKPDFKKLAERPNEPVRVEPDRKWFGNVRTIDQKSLEKFRIEMAQKTQDPYNILIKQRKLPISLLTEPTKQSQVNLLEVETFEDTFGPKSTRKKPKLNSFSLESILEKAESVTSTYKVDKDSNYLKQLPQEDREEQRDKRLEAGQSKRIWNELYKVLDASDVVCQILDARDPIGTRCRHVEEHLKKNAPHKHMVLLLNKCDLVPTSVTAKWVKYLSQEYPTLAYRASIQNPFGKAQLIQILRQFDNFHKDKKNISVGYIGYPNVGKSSIINSLRKRRVCNAAPIPGETKRIYLIDCPGIVYQGDYDNEVDMVLKGVVRAEKLLDPTYYIDAILARAKSSDIQKIYGVSTWVHYEDFLQQLAQKSGKLLKGGEGDLKTVARSIIIDWQRGKIPYFCLPPGVQWENKKEEETALQEADKIAEKQAEEGDINDPNAQDQGNQEPEQEEEVEDETNEQEPQ